MSSRKKSQLPAGVKRIELHGRLDREGKRVGERIVFEVKAYNAQTKKTEYVGRLADEDSAVQARLDYRRKWSAGSIQPAQRSWREVVELDYLKRTARLGRRGGNIKKSTINANDYATRSFVCRFGEMRLDRVKEGDLLAWCATQPGHVVEGVRALFSWAHKMRLLDINPMSHVDSRRGDGRKDLLVISTADLEVLTLAARECWPGLLGLRLAVLLTVLAYCGMRPSEAFALRPEHLDLERRRIDLDWQFDEKGELQPLKNGRKRRIVMAPEAHDALKLLLPHIAKNGLLFVTARGCKLNAKSAWHYYWNPIRKRVPGLGTMDVYELRHYCATIMLDNGATPEQVALQLGHTDGGELVRKLYGHPDIELQLAALQKITENRIHDIRRRGEPLPPKDRETTTGDDGMDIAA